MNTSAVTAACPEHAAQTVGVRFARDSDGAAWDTFVQQCPDATFFHRFGWRQIIEGVFRHRTHYLVAERDGVVSGVLPLAEVKSRMFGHSLTSLPFCVYGGPAADDEQSERALIEEATRLAQSLGVEHLELRNRRAKCPTWAHQDIYVTFRRDLLPETEANLSAVPRKQRAMIRKGIKHGLRGEIDSSVERFFALYADNAHRHGTPPFAKEYFVRLRKVFGDDCEVLIIVDAQGRPVSGVMSFYFRDGVLPYYAGDTVAARDLAANDFKYWELMQRACARGLRVFDYGRSKQGTGSYDFKKNWGFEPVPLSYEFRLLKRETVPQNNPLNPKYRTLIAIWRRLPLPVANALGPRIVRNLG
ncbi:MAG: FemAB family XrtA/PEP-CTERM system-associated protein [Betaproteobacteria bacterium]